MLTVGEKIGERLRTSLLFVAGALEPGCEGANLAFLAMGPKEKKTIIITGITRVPYESDIPEEIRKGWIGAIIMGVHGPLTAGMTDEGSDRSIFVKGFVVETSVALQSLKIVSEISWNWFLDKKLPEYLFFNEECCEIIT